MSSLVVTDITDLGKGHVCLAGVERGTLVQRRLSNPWPEYANPVVRALRPGSTIAVNLTPQPHIHAPHVEDSDWTVPSLMREGQLSYEDLTSLLESSTFDSVEEAFGKPLLRSKGGSGAWPPTGGVRSLATVRVSGVDVGVDWGKARVSFSDAHDEWRGVPLQDVVVKTHIDSCMDCVGRLERNLRTFRMEHGVIRVGLARAYSAGEYPLACWLQVNNILIADRGHFV